VMSANSKDIFNKGLIKFKYTTELRLEFSDSTIIAMQLYSCTGTKT
jgi:hypothetical protein